MARYTLRQMAHFVAAARAGSMAAGAALEHVSPTAVAASITELERIFKTSLTIRRKSHGITLTPTGTYLLRRASALLDEADQLELDAVSGGVDLSGPLEIGSYRSLAPTMLPDLLRRFQALHPRVELDFVEGSQDVIQEHLFEGRVDLAILYDLGLRTGLESVELVRGPSYCLLPRGHPFAEAASVSLHELAEEPLIMMDAPPFAGHVRSLFAGAGLTPTVRHRTVGLELLRALVGQGLGYAIIAQRPPGDLSYEGMPLVARPIEPEPDSISTILAWPTAMELSDRAKAMVALAAAKSDPKVKP